MFRRLFASLGRWATWIAGEPSDPEAAILSMLQGRGGKSATGLRITEDAALCYSALWSGVTLLGECLGSLPLDVYKRLDDDGREKDSKHNLAGKLRRRPNPHMSAFAFKESLMINAVLWGNGYAEIERSVDGAIVSLWPIHPSLVMPKIDAGGELYYEVKIPNSTDTAILSREDILHITAPSLDGITGMGVVQKAKESIGLGLATERFGAAFFGNNATPGLLLKTAQPMPDPTRDAIVKSWRENYGGLSNAHRVAVLTHGLEAQILSVAPELAQFLETRRFQTEEIARWLRMPLHLLRDTTKGASYASLEVQSTEFLLYTLRPWLARFEDEFNFKLLGEEERATTFLEFNPAALLRADLNSRYQAYTLGRNGGWLSVNDIRKAENLPPIDDGDEYLVPLNMTPAGGAGGAAVEPPRPPTPNEGA